MGAATLLRQARLSIAVSQRELAQRAGVAQPAVAVVERSHRDPSVGTLEHLLRSAGHRLITIPTWATTAAEAADELRQAVGSDRQTRALRLLIGFSDGLAAQSPDVRVALCVTRPASCGDRRIDAALAGLVEHHLAPGGLPIPAWVSEPERSLADEWVVDPYAADDIAAVAVPALHRHGVLLAKSELASV